MAAKSRRRSRESALRAMYHIELGGAGGQRAVKEAAEAANLSEDQIAYLEELVNGTREHQEEIDRTLGELLIGYDFERLAVIDRNVLRIAAYELAHIPSIPPAVTINEAVEIAKKYSTQESGKFVNGVLGRFLELTPKRDWDPETAPPEFGESEPEPEAPIIPEVEEVTIEEGSDEAKVAKRYGWVLKSGDAEIPPLTPEEA